MNKILRSRAFWHATYKAFLAYFGAFWLVVEPVGILVVSNTVNGWVIYLGLLILSLLCAVLSSWPREFVIASIPGSDVEVVVKVGNIFDAKGNVVIGVNDVFDTHIGDGIIDTRSVQAQFTFNRFDGSVYSLDAYIEPLLSDLRYEVDESKAKGKNKRYPLGTCLEVTAKGVRHYLLAYSRMSPALCAEGDLCGLLKSLDSCWSKIRVSGQNEGVSMPVLGGEFARIGLTQTQLIQILVLSFINANRKEHIAPRLTIYVYEGKSDLVDFAALRVWLRGVLWA